MKKIKFSFEIKLTTTKIIAWTILIWSHCIVTLIPLEGRVYYLSIVYGTVVLLYTGKNIQEYYKYKKNEKSETF